MKNRSKLTPQQQSEQQSAQESKEQAREFATAEEMIRVDAAEMPVPPQIAARLKESIAAIAPAQRKSWWKNIFGQ